MLYKGPPAVSRTRLCFQQHTQDRLTRRAATVWKRNGLVPATRQRPRLCEHRSATKMASRIYDPDPPSSGLS